MDTLVLNKLYYPIHIIEWHKSMSLLYKDSAHSLDHDYVQYDFDRWLAHTGNLSDEWRTIGTVRGRIAIPEIIVLVTYNRLPPQDIKFNREGIFQRDKYTCQYCGKKFTKSSLTKDHVIPKDAGGKNTWTNIVSSCWTCNQKKKNRTPSQAGMQLINEPTEPKWLHPLSHAIRHPKACKSWKAFLKEAGDEEN